MNSKFTVSNSQARRLIFKLQGLADPPHVKIDKGQLLDLIGRMGFVQVDSIQWVERAHHMILFSRNQTYRPKQLKHLLERERSLFENWTHDASIIPSEFYPYWRHKFERNAARLKKSFINWQGEGFLDHCEQLVARIDSEGQLRSRDMESPSNNKKAEMWQWHDGKAALEFLWRTGQLGIAGRDHFQKIYDLCHRTIPEPCYGSEVSREEFIDWACRSALQRLGFGTAADIARFWDLLSIQEVKHWLEGAGKDSIVNIQVEQIEGGTYRDAFALINIEEQMLNLPDLPGRVRVLSPFDPVIRDRTRLERLFGFDFRIEIYVPKDKRKYGYYVFPLLENDRLIGRVDMRADRKSDCLEIKRLWLEEKVKPSAGRMDKLHAEFTRQCRLAGVSGVHYLDGWLG